VAALFYFCPEVELKCSVFDLCRVLCNLRLVCPLVSGFTFQKCAEGLYSEEVMKAVREMERARFLVVDWEKDRIRVVKTMGIKAEENRHDAFVEEIRQIDGFDKHRDSLAKAGRSLADEFAPSHTPTPVRAVRRS
jgi:hypothetical protein